MFTHLLVHLEAVITPLYRVQIMKTIDAHATPSTATRTLFTTLTERERARDLAQEAEIPGAQLDVNRQTLPRLHPCRRN